MIVLQAALQRSQDAAVGELTYAASAGDLEIVRTLVARGVRVNAGDYDFRTTIHLAVAEGRTDIVRFLVGKGVKVLRCHML